jgi:3-isopropylmalate/(R)-2-methylmalate dehydratase small subunit
MMEPVRVISGKVAVLDRPDVDTDQIVPKQFLKRLVRNGFEDALFHDWAKQPGWELPRHPILATGRNFGCGSSREQAAWALQDYGFRVVIAPSFGDIFFNNCTKVGLLPVTLRESEVRAVIAAGRATVDLETQHVKVGEQRIRFEFDPNTRERLLEGADEVAVTLRKLDLIERFESRVSWPVPSTL